MNPCNACLLSNDEHLGARLQQLLRDETEEIEFFSTTVAKVADTCSRQPQPTVALVDLRNGETAHMWDCLRRLQRRWWECNGRNVPVIGVVEEGLSIHDAVIADQSLSGLLGLSEAPRQLAKLLRKTQSEQPRLNTMTPVDCRVIEGTKSKFITYSPELFHVLDDLETAARRDFTVLLIGETGTGKTTLARIVHELSSRRDMRFVNVPCGSLPGELVDSELFGHVRGAFTGAERDKEGKFLTANGGTILLDEIDVLGMMQQAKLLRVLESGEFEPVGSNDTYKANARTIVASNVCLHTLMENQQFRPDLFYRLDQVRFEIPPLRRRPNDIIPIAAHYIEECCRESDLPRPRIHPDFLAALKQYEWPGNIRELRNEVRRAVLFARGGILSPARLSNSVKEGTKEKANAVHDAPSARSALASEVALAECDAIEQMLAAHDFNRAATARALGISRVTLYNKMRKYGIRTGQRGRGGR